MVTPGIRRFTGLAGGLLAGYGALILAGFLAHESRFVGALLLLGGAALLAPTLGRHPETRRPLPGVRLAACLVGLLFAGGTLGYNLAAGSALSLPEAALLAYGLALLAAAPHAHRPRVDQALAWSFPLVAAPLGLYAVDALLDATQGGSPVDAFIRVGLVAPLSGVLGLLGFDALAHGQTIHLETPRGGLSLTVGVVCAGFQPGVVFLGLLGMHAWQNRTPPGRLALLLGLGLAGVYLANLLRLLVLVLVGHQWGGVALTQTHAHAGWVVFVAWMLLYWWLVLRRLDPVRKVPIDAPA